jgi:hypothetical protein
MKLKKKKNPDNNGLDQFHVDGYMLCKETTAPHE